jgi:hypothetical protein
MPYLAKAAPVGFLLVFDGFPSSSCPFPSVVESVAPNQQSGLSTVGRPWVGQISGFLALAPQVGEVKR